MGMRSWGAVLVAGLLGAQVPPVQEAPLRAHLAMLADDLFEGRSTGGRGGQLTVRYLETHLQALGLEPVRGSNRLAVSLVGLHPRPEATNLAIQGPKGAHPLVPGETVVLSAGADHPPETWDAPLIFAGFGIQAPVEGWDDFKGTDVKGAVLVVLVNDPPPTAEEPTRFNGASMSYFGRWSYKFEEARRQGAAGVLLVHTTERATYGWSVVRNSFSGWRWHLAARPGLPLQGWITETALRRLPLPDSMDWSTLLARAERRDFRPVSLGLRLKGRWSVETQHQQTFNVLGAIPGSDPSRRSENVLYTAHWDHFGLDPALARHGDGIYNGAVDNASGCAGLLAMAQAARANPTPRTQIFMFTAAEEQGLLGSMAFVAEPPVPLASIQAVLNLDSLNFVGRVGSVSLVGAERTTAKPLVEAVAKAHALRLLEPGIDRGGGYFRSDHFPFVQAGVVAFSVGMGRDFLNDPEASLRKANALGARYHQVTEEYDPGWDLSGMVQQCQFTLDLGSVLAAAPEKPAWIRPEIQAR